MTLIYLIYAQFTFIEDSWSESRHSSLMQMEEESNVTVIAYQTFSLLDLG